MQCLTNVDDAVPTLYKCYTDVMCLLIIGGCQPFPPVDPCGQWGSITGLRVVAVCDTRGGGATGNPCKHKTLTQCCFIVGPTSETAGQHHNNIGSVSLFAGLAILRIFPYSTDISCFLNSTGGFIYEVDSMDFFANICFKFS